MPKIISKKKQNIKVEAYSHKGKKRKNNPHVGLVSSATDKLNGRTNYQHDPHINPFLSWAGKAECQSFEVQNISLHIHERIDSKRIIQSFTKMKDANEKQFELFGQPENEPPLNKAIDFYRHDQDWTNRMIAGDSLLVMNSLLKKEGMAGKVQMVYIDPPYGIKYNSNFQPFVNSKDVKDGSDADIPAEPELIQAFRDTWELGIHSYLTYLRDRLFLSRELLHESGSCFVQISDENVHHVRELMDEIFGKENFVAIIPFRKKTMPLGAKYLEQMYDFIIWYAKSKEKLKYIKLFKDYDVQGNKDYNWYELPDGTEHEMSSEQINNHKLLPKGARVFLKKSLRASGVNPSGLFSYQFKGKDYPSTDSGYCTNKDGMDNLLSKNKITVKGNLLTFKYFVEDYPVTSLLSLWDDTVGSQNKIYVVQTSEIPIQRCLLMTTDPGDLVLDPTCGSGTTAYVAEQWGRRWITCDTSRVAITLAKQRLMTSKFEYYELAHANEGIRSGFKYRTVPHITLGSIANNEPAKQETLYDQPIIEKKKLRVTGPFTVEAVPCLRVKPFDGNELKVEATNEQLTRTGETGKQAEWRDELKTTGIRTTGGKVIQFARIEPMVATRFLHAEAEIIDGNGDNKKAYISFGPDFGPLEQRQVEEAIKEARGLKIKPSFVIFAAFHFDPEAAKDIDQINWKDVILLKAQMSVDLLTKDLRKKRSSSHSYWLIGQPDVDVVKVKEGKYKVIVRGFDYYNPVIGEIESKGTKQIAMWFLDTDYDERSLYPDQVFFPEGDSKRDWSRLAKALNGEVNEDLLELFSGSIGKYKKEEARIFG